MYFQRRRGTQVVVYYKADSGKLQTVPRKYIRHLDQQADHNVEAWISEHRGRWEQTDVAPRGLVLSGNQLDEWLDSWRAHRIRRQQGCTNTIRRSVHALHYDIFPFFIEQPTPLLDPNTWPAISFGLTEWQERRGVSEANRVHAAVALRKFWKWLGDTGKILPGIPIPIDNSRRTPQPTSLQYTLTPEDALAFARRADERIRLMVLIGYFASLRPRELLALRRCDFYAGAAVERKECCLVMANHGHFGKMAVDIHRQRHSDGSFGPPKSYSLGLVALFSEPAAVMLREILLAREPDALLFDFLPDWNAELWKRGGLPGLDLHDLRKASIYWLGHHGGLDLIPLRNHARHAKVETTMLYCRRPVESASGESGGLDW